MNNSTAKLIAEKLNKIGKNIPKGTDLILVVSAENELLCIFNGKNPTLDFSGFEEFEGDPHSLESITGEELTSICPTDLWDLFKDIHKAVYLDEKHIDLETRYL